MVYNKVPTIKYSRKPGWVACTSLKYHIALSSADFRVKSWNVVVEKWYLADPAMLPKRPNSKTELKTKIEIRTKKSLFGENANVGKIPKYKNKIKYNM